MLFIRTCGWSLAIAVFGLTMAAAYGGWIGVLLVGAVGSMLFATSYETAIAHFYFMEEIEVPSFWRMILPRIGLPLIVFGVSLAFPMAILSIIVWRNPVDVVTLVFTDQTSYQQLTTNANPASASFVAGFLLTMFFDYFFEERNRTWLHCRFSRRSGAIESR